MSEMTPESAPRAQLVRFGDQPHQVLALPVAEMILRYFATHDRRKFAQALGAAMVPELADEPKMAAPRGLPDLIGVDQSNPQRGRFGRERGQALGAAMVPEPAEQGPATPQPGPAQPSSAPEQRRRFGRD